MNREQKAATIEVLAREIKDAATVLAVDYRGISVPQAAELRTKLRDADATFRVVKNSLTERAADQAGVETLKSLLQGPTALTFVRGDAAVAAKAIADYARATQLLPFKGGLMDGATLDAEQIRALSRLPSRDVLYGQLVGVVASPVTGLVRTLGALIGGLAVALGQVREKKESGEIPAGDPPASAQSAGAQAPAAEGQPSPAPAPEVAAPEAAAPDAGSGEAEAPGASKGDQAPGDPQAAESETDPPAPASGSADADAAQAAAVEVAPAQEVADSPVSDEAPAEEVASEAAPGAPAAPAASAGEQAEPEPAPEHKDNQADASA